MATGSPALSELRDWNRRMGFEWGFSGTIYTPVCNRNRQGRIEASNPSRLLDLFGNQLSRYVCPLYILAAKVIGGLNRDINCGVTMEWAKADRKYSRSFWYWHITMTTVYNTAVIRKCNESSWLNLGSCRYHKIPICILVRRYVTYMHIGIRLLSFCLLVNYAH